jgi:hypothetical protein
MLRTSGNGHGITTCFPSALLINCRRMQETHVQELTLGIIFVQQSGILY